MPKRNTKKITKQKQQSKGHKQKQRQSVNVNVNIDQSKRSAPRKPKDVISKVGGQMIPSTEGNSIRFNTQAPFYMPPPVFYQPPPPQQFYQPQQQENYALNRIERLLTEKTLNRPLAIENNPIYGLSSVDTKNDSMSEAITKDHNADLLEDIYRKVETPSKFHLIDNPAMFSKGNPLANPLSQVVNKEKLKRLNIKPQELNKMSEKSPKKKIEDIDEEGNVWIDYDDDDENVNKVLKIEDIGKEAEDNIDDEGPKKELTKNEKAKEIRKLKSIGTLPTKLEQKSLEQLQKIASDLGIKTTNPKNKNGKETRKTKEVLILEIKDKRTSPEKLQEITNYIQNIKEAKAPTTPISTSKTKKQSKNNEI